MAYGLSNGHVTDDVTWPPKVLWGSTVSCPSDAWLLVLILCICSVRLFISVAGGLMLVLRNYLKFRLRVT